MLWEAYVDNKVVKRANNTLKEIKARLRISGVQRSLRMVTAFVFGTDRAYDDLKVRGRVESRTLQIDSF